MGAVLLAAGAAGKRFCLPHARVMIHQPLGGFQGQASDIEIHAKYILALRERLNELMAKNSSESAVLFTTLPGPGEGTGESEEESGRYLGDLEVLCRGCPPVLMVHSNSMTVTMSL